ncbi:MAG: hydantoinase/oxoprolinase family protein, partial [Planctomycetia bacterium]
VDVGSTTTDLIPIVGGRPVPRGRTDPDRLASGELIYLGVERTPLFGLLPSATVAGRRHGTAAELFTTLLDVFLWTNDLPVDAERTDTADGKPADRPHALDRLARLVCSDRTRFTSADADAVAAQAVAAALDRIDDGVGRIVAASFPSGIARVVIGGQGEFLGRRLVERSPTLNRAEVALLSATLGAAASSAAPAYAVAVLLDETAPSG